MNINKKPLRMLYRKAKRYADTLWAEGERVISGLVGVAEPERCAGALIVSIGIRVRAVALKVVIVLHARCRAGRGQVVRAYSRRQICGNEQMARKLAHQSSS